MKKRISAIFTLLMFLSFSLSTGFFQPIEVSAAAGATTVDSIVYDVVGSPYNTNLGAPWGKHEAIPHGLPSSYDWYGGAIPGAWMDTAAFNGLTTWGQVYEDAAESPVTNIRVQVRNLYTYAYINNSWQLIESAPDDITGDNFSEDFTRSASRSNVRSEVGNGGGISFTMVNGWNYHWWANHWPRAAMPHNATALYTSVEIRLIPNTDPNVDLNNAKYIACAGMDYYAEQDTIADAPVEAAGIPRMKYVKPYWQTFSMYVSGSIPTSESGYRNEINSRPLPPGVSGSPSSSPSPTPTPTPTPTVTPANSYLEDFNDGQAQNWTLSNASVSDNSLVCSSNSGTGSGIYGGQSWSTNYSYKVDANTSYGSATNKSHVFFNYVDSSNYYFIEIAGGTNNSVVLKKKVAGTESTIATYGKYSIYNTTANFEIIYETGGYITVKGRKGTTTTTLFNRIQDSSLTSGKVGVGVLYSNTTFDNVNVSAF